MECAIRQSFAHFDLVCLFVCVHNYWGHTVLMNGRLSNKNKAAPFCMFLQTEHTSTSEPDMHGDGCQREAHTHKSWHKHSHVIFVYAKANHRPQL